MNTGEPKGKAGEPEGKAGEPGEPEEGTGTKTNRAALRQTGLRHLQLE